MTRTVVEFTYRNGRFGTNTASLARTSRGYSVRPGSGDAFFVASPVEAKAMFRAILANVEGAAR